MLVEQKMGGPEFRIGGVEIYGRAVLAPLSGVTDAVFRRIAKRFGAGIVVSEMVASDELVSGSSEARLRAEGGGIDPHVVQLAGCEPKWMGEAVRVAEAAGARVIDINMGCPAKRVTGGYAGSALMRDLDQASRIIEAVVAAASCPVTVKMRLGWDHASLNAADLARRAEALGASGLTVHGRTRQQFYKGKADWLAIAEVAAAVRIPVVANGDVVTADDARRCLAASGAAAVMLGRAAVGRPWLIGQVGAALAGRAVPEPSPSVMAATVVEHYEGLLGLYGVQSGLRHARKHLAAYADIAAASGFHVDSADRPTLVTTESPSAVIDILHRLYDRPERRAA
jgi:nifR3 family TIM-barrel protein